LLAVAFKEENMAAKKMKARVLYDFEDLQENVIRRKGDEFEVTKIRFNEINKRANEHYGQDYIEEVIDESKE
jgi:hypothetical protein